MHQIKHFSFLFLCILMCTLLGACGSKGALYEADEVKADQKVIKKSPQPSQEKPKKK